MGLSGVVDGGRDVTASAAAGTGTITNDDAAEFTVDSQSGTEDGGAITFKVTLSNPVDVATSVDVSTSDGTALLSDSDYTQVSGLTLNFAAGVTSQTFDVTPTADNKVEPDEDFSVGLSGVDDGGGRDVTASAAAGTGTILNDDFLTGLVFDDLDNDGVFEPTDGDAGIEGVLMRLVNQTSGLIVDSDTTDNNGRYVFNVTLDSGIYKIVEVVDEAVDLGLLDGKETEGVNGGTVDNTQDSNEITNIDITGTGTPNAAAADYLFGEVGGSDLFGTVWRDFNDDAEINFGESGIDNVVLALTGLDDRDNSVNLSDTTAADGSYAFINLRPGTYAIDETQPAGFDDGQESLGEVTDLDLPTAVAAPGVIDGNDKFSGIQLVPKSEGDMYNFGERPQAGESIGESVTATIGFWHNKNGQNLIKSLNGGQTDTTLGDWLAATFPEMYGPGAFYDAAQGADQDMNLTGKTNAEVAEIFKFLHKRNKKTSVAGGPTKVDAQLMAVALATFVTSENLAGGNIAASYGFSTSADGIAYTTFNVLDVLTAQEAEDLGLTDDVMDALGNVTIIDILLTTDQMATAGLLYDVNGGGIESFELVLRILANELLTAINEGSDI